MKTQLLKLKRCFLKLAAWFPTKIPTGVAEQNAWVDSIIDLYAFPNNDSLRFAIATMILHGGPTEARKPKRYFYLAVSAGMSRQVAADAMQTLKNKQIAAAEAEKAAKAAEVPALSVVPDASK